MDQISIKTGHIVEKMGQNALNQIETEIKTAKEHLLKGDAEGNDFLGWVDLPETYDKAEYARMKARNWQDVEDRR